MAEPLSWTPFLEKGLPKIKEGGHLTLIGQFLEYTPLMGGGLLQEVVAHGGSTIFNSYKRRDSWSWQY